MGLLVKLILILIPIGIGYVLMGLLQDDPIPKVEDEYWGPKSEEGKKEDTSIRPFKIDIPAAELDDLKSRLKRELDSNRLVPPLEGIGFEYGFNSKYLKTVGDYWLNKYDWKAREKLLNKYPHFKTKIGGLDIHFQHVKPAQKTNAETRPVLLMHGWPGSVVELQKIIPLLSEPKNSKYNYELIIPSLPGYGFSSGAARPGMSQTEIANVMKRLMNRLGHKKFLIMGEDWGALIVSDLATLYPESVLGAYSTMCGDRSGRATLKSFLATSLPSIFSTPDEIKHIRGAGESFSFIIRESGYFHLHATKPDTIGVALVHSPLGLASYILEKFSAWTNRDWISREDGGILEKFTLDDLLDNIMWYWVSGSITTSARLYAESFDPKKTHHLDKVPTNVPFNCQLFANDIATGPRYAVTSKFTNLKSYKIWPTGGHFAFLEVPQVIADEALSFFNSL